MSKNALDAFHNGRNRGDRAPESQANHQAHGILAGMSAEAFQALFHAGGAHGHKLPGLKITGHHHESHHGKARHHETHPNNNTANQ